MLAKDVPMNYQSSFGSRDAGGASLTTSVPGKTTWPTAPWSTKYTKIRSFGPLKIRFALWPHPLVKVPFNDASVAAFQDRLVARKDCKEVGRRDCVAAVVNLGASVDVDFCRRVEYLSRVGVSKRSCARKSTGRLTPRYGPRCQRSE